MSQSDSDGLTEVDRKILDFLELADGEGCALGHDIAVGVGVAPRSIGSRLAALVRRGYVHGHLIPGLRQNVWTLAPTARPWR